MLNFLPKMIVNSRFCCYKGIWFVKGVCTQEFKVPIHVERLTSYDFAHSSPKRQLICFFHTSM